MTNRLTLGMYGGEFGSSPYDSDLFGLQTGQMRRRSGNNSRIIKDAGWYNAEGHKLGWGDIGAGDIQSISSQLLDTEIFVVLGEADSYSEFIEEGDQAIIGSLARTDKTQEFLPGQAYVAAKAILALTPNVMIDTGAYGIVQDFHRLYPDSCPELEIVEQSPPELYLTMERIRQTAAE